MRTDKNRKEDFLDKTVRIQAIMIVIAIIIALIIILFR